MTNESNGITSTLTFPTMADLAYEEFTNAVTTVSLVTIAKRRGAQIVDRWPGARTYLFDDDTSLVVTGRGMSHKVEVMLP